MRNYIHARIALASLVGLASAAHGQAFIGNPSPKQGDSGVFAYWDFEFTPIDKSLVVSTFYGQAGSAFLDFSEFGGELESFRGSGINQRGAFGDSNRTDIAFRNGLNGDAIVGTFFQIDFDMTGLKDLVIDYAVQGSATGPDDVRWQYSTDGVVFTNFGPNVGARSIAMRTLASREFGIITTDALDNQSSVALRMYFYNGAAGSSVPFAETGNNRIDNLSLSATIYDPDSDDKSGYVDIPEPGTFALLAGFLGMGYTAMRRRGRNRSVQLQQTL